MYCDVRQARALAGSCGSQGRRTEVVRLLGLLDVRLVAHVFGRCLGTYFRSVLHIGYVLYSDLMEKLEPKMREKPHCPVRWKRAAPTESVKKTQASSSPRTIGSLKTFLHDRGCYVGAILGNDVDCGNEVEGVEITTDKGIRFKKVGDTTIANVVAPVDLIDKLSFPRSSGELGILKRWAYTFEMNDNVQGELLCSRFRLGPYQQYVLQADTLTTLECVHSPTSARTVTTRAAARAGESVIVPMSLHVHTCSKLAKIPSMAVDLGTHSKFRVYVKGATVIASSAEVPTGTRAAAKAVECVNPFWLVKQTSIVGGKK